MSEADGNPGAAKADRKVFILGGGAVLGAHQVGALKYLEEVGVKPDVLICSSIGVINGCVYGSGGVVALEEAWKGFRTLPILLPSLKDNLLTGLSLVSSERAAAALEEFMDFPQLFESELDIEIIVLNLSRGEGQMWSSRNCVDWREFRQLTRAGWALPPVFPPLYADPTDPTQRKGTGTVASLLSNTLSGTNPASTTVRTCS